MDKCEEAFDKSFGIVFKNIEMTPEVPENTRNMMLQLYSSGWHDSRAALVVKLPLWQHLPNGNQAYSATEVKGALKDVGIKFE